MSLSASVKSKNSVMDGLSEITLDDFLKEEIPEVQKDNGMGIPPMQIPYYRGRIRGVVGKRVGPSRDGGNNSNPWMGGAPIRGPHGPVHPGPLMTHYCPQPRHRIPRTPLTRPSESVLTVGSHEAQRIKEGGRKPLIEGEMVLDREAVLNNAQPYEEVQYILQQKINPNKGQNYHFMPVADVALIQRDRILKLMVSLLNTGIRGVIYLGIEEDSTVSGVVCEAQLMAQFVEGLMKTVQFYLMPRLHAPQYGVRYVNVLTEAGKVLNNLWVVELHAVPDSQYYYNAIMDMNYRVLDEKQYKSVPFPKFCDSIVTSASKEYESVVGNMEARVRKLEQILTKNFVDISQVEPHVCADCWFNDCPIQCYGDFVDDTSSNISVNGM